MTCQLHALSFNCTTVRVWFSLCASKAEATSRSMNVALHDVARCYCTRPRAWQGRCRAWDAENLQPALVASATLAPTSVCTSFRLHLVDIFGRAYAVDCGPSGHRFSPCVATAFRQLPDGKEVEAAHEIFFSWHP